MAELASRISIPGGASSSSPPPSFSLSGVVFAGVAEAEAVAVEADISRVCRD